MEIKLGDTVTVKRACSGCVTGVNYKITDRNGVLKADASPFTGDNTDGCACINNWVLVLKSLKSLESLAVGDKVRNYTDTMTVKSIKMVPEYTMQSNLVGQDEETYTAELLREDDYTAIKKSLPFVRVRGKKYLVEDIIKNCNSK